MQALAVIPSIINASNQVAIINSLQLRVTDSIAAPVIGYLLKTVRSVNRSGANALEQQLLQQYSNNNYVADAIISTMEGKEDELAKELIAKKIDTTLVIFTRLEKVRKDKLSRQSSKMNAAVAKLYPLGNRMFRTICQTCHGVDGNGVQSLAPPLKGSEWVQGNIDKLSSIVLYGLTGPVEVSGKLYKSPEINGDMPGIGSNDEFGDQDIAQLLSFIRNAWGNKGAPVTDKDIQKIRKQYRDRQKPFTMEELKKN